MLPLTSFLMRSPVLSRGFSSSPSILSKITALIYQASELGNNVQVYLPDYSLVVTRDGLVESDKPLNKITLPFNECRTHEVETYVLKRQLSKENVDSFIQRVKQRAKKIEDINIERDKIRKRLRELDNMTVLEKQRNDVKNFLDSFEGVPTGLQRGRGGLIL